MVEVRNPQHVTLEDLMIGSHDAGAMNNGIDIQQQGSANSSHMTYDGVYVFGMFQKAPLGKSLRFDRLGEKDVVNRLLHLSTFMGHAHPSSTAVYLTITADLLKEANQRFEGFASPLLKGVMS